MTTFILIRHAAHDRVGRYLDGRRAGVHLSDIGRVAASVLARRLGREPIDAIFSSPRERTVETANAIAEQSQLEVIVEPALDEIDFGEWTGRSFDELAADERWHAWNQARSTTRTPAGDTMRASQARILDFIDATREIAPDATNVLVSHADPLKAVLAFYLGLSLDDLQRFDLSPASVSRIDVHSRGTRVLSVNERLDA